MIWPFRATSGSHFLRLDERWVQSEIRLHDFDDFGRNVASVRQWRAGNPQATIMAALNRSVPQPGPPTSQIKVDMSLVTCKQFLSSDAERQDMIACWMSDYFRASRSQPIFDCQRFANTKKAVTNYYVMSTIQISAR
jgi:hypothetical protein